MVNTKLGNLVELADGRYYVDSMGADNFGAEVEMLGAVSAPTTQPRMAISRGGGYVPRANIPQLRPEVIQKPVTRELGTVQQIDHTNNQLVGAAGFLLVNVASVETCVFRYTIPNNRKFHFKPQNIGGIDPNITTFILDALHTATTPAYLNGSYKIMVWNANRSQVKAVLASGSLRKFGFGVTVQASLTDIQTRVYYSVDYLATEEQQIELYITSPIVLSPANSSLVMEFVEYVP